MAKIIALAVALGAAYVRFATSLCRMLEEVEAAANER